MPRKRVVTLFRPKQKPPKGRKPLVAFRAPPDIKAYLDVLKERGYGATEAIIDLFRIGMDAERELGDDLDQVQQMAHSANVSVGGMLGQLAKRALGRKPKK